MKSEKQKIAEINKQIDQLKGILKHVTMQIVKDNLRFELDRLYKERRILLTPMKERIRLAELQEQNRIKTKCHETKRLDLSKVPVKNIWRDYDEGGFKPAKLADLYNQPLAIINHVINHEGILE